VYVCCAVYCAVRLFFSMCTYTIGVTGKVVDVDLLTLLCVPFAVHLCMLMRIAICLVIRVIVCLLFRCVCVNFVYVMLLGYWVLCCVVPVCVLMFVVVLVCCVSVVV